MKVCAFWYSVDEQYGVLDSIQIEFNNGFKTPPFKSSHLIVKQDGSVHGAQRISICPNGRIEKIGMQVYDADHYTGIRFYGREGKLIVEKIWKNSSKAMWITYDVPEMNEICGIGATMNRFDSYIIQVGF